ncbi:MAG TPA: protein kinase, partial [Gemmataceae bacterium]|nr:protein kinase [Gemmataceae bacterium]
RRVEHLCYTSGRALERPEWAAAQQGLLARLLDLPVDAGQAEGWAARSEAEERAASPADEEGPPSCRRLGEFELLSRIGRGGMGVVYRAWQPSLGRQVALKCLLRSGDPKAEARFAREIRALGKVEHPHLVKVFTSGSDGDQWFYAMELVEGADLGAVCSRLAGSTASEVGEDDWTTAVSSAWQEQRRQEQALSDGAVGSAVRTETTDTPGAADAVRTADPTRPASAGSRPTGWGHIARVVEVVRQAAEAAHALHEAGVIHRDIKPGNVLLAADGGHAVLMDLGLAQLADEAEGRLTRTRQFVGTLRYASPEQVLAADRLDRRADVYSLGATLWELLTLRPMFGADDGMRTPDLMLKIQTTDPERVRKHNPRVPADLEAIVLKCLAKERERRYATAAELAADLARWQRGKPVLAQPPSLGYLLGKVVRRYRGPLAATAAVLLAAVVGVVAAFWQISAAYELEKAAKHDAQDRERDAKAALSREQEALGREKDAKQEAQDKEREVGTALAKLEAKQSELARSPCEVSDGEFRKGNVRDGLDWMLRAYEVAPATDPLRVSYRQLLAGHGLSLERRLYHEGWVTAVAFSPDGRLALTGSASALEKGRGEARLWEATTGKPVATLRHEGGVTAVAFSPDGRLALTGSEDKTARLWEAATGKPVGQPLRHEDWVDAVAFSPDSRLILVASTSDFDRKGAARLWSVLTGKCAAVLPHDRGVHAVAFSPDGRLALTGSGNAYEGEARLWEVATGKSIKVLGHEDEVNAVAFSPDGHLALTGSGYVLGSKGEARLWETATGKRLVVLHHEGPVSAVAFSPDGRLALTGSHDRTARLWQAATGKPLATLHHEVAVHAVAFSPDGRLALTDGDRTARLWEVRPRSEAAVFAHGGPVYATAFSPNGRLVLTGSQDRMGRLWDVALGKPLATLPHEGAVRAVAFSPDGALVLTGSDDRTARLWDAGNGKPLAVLHHEDMVRAVAFSPDGHLLLTGSFDNTARLWEAATGKEITVLHHDNGVRAVLFSPDGQWMLTGSDDGGARVWRTTTGEEVAVLRHTAPVIALALSPDARLALTAAGDTAQVYVTATGKRMAVLQHKGLVRAVAFSPNGRLVLTGSEDQTARLWEAATGKPLTVFAHGGKIHVATFSPDGRLALTAGENGTAYLWEIATGKLLTILPHGAGVRDVTFSSDGRLALTGGDDGAARLWEVVPPAPDNLERLRAWVQVRTGEAFDDRGVLRGLSLTEWLGAWRDLEANGGDWQAPPDPRRWHLSQAADAEAAKDWFAAAFHLDRLLKMAPEDSDLRRRLDAARAHQRK